MTRKERRIEQSRCDPSLCPPVRPERRDNLVGASPTRAMVGWPGSWQAVRSGNWPYRSPATNVALGGGANRRAVTCVKPEQASKGKSWTPTRPEFGEGSTVWGSSRQTHPDWSIGVRGTARRDRGSRKRGRPVLDEGSGLNDTKWHRSARESDGVVVPLKPGNAGGGKDPDFWCVCRRRRGSVTWREPVKHRLRPGAFRANFVVTPRRCGDVEYAHVDARRMPAMKPVGKPDAGNPHVRFDERGGETGRFGDTAPLLDSTVKSFLIPQPFGPTTTTNFAVSGMFRIRRSVNRLKLCNLTPVIFIPPLSISKHMVICTLPHLIRVIR